MALAQTSSTVIPSGFGYDKAFGEAWSSAPGADGGFLALYANSVVALPNLALLREVAFRPPSYSHGATRRSFDVYFGYPASGVTPDSMPLNRAAIVAGGLAGLTKVASNVVTSMPAFAPGNGLAPFGVTIKTTPFIYDASRGGLVVQIVGKQIAGFNQGYFIDRMEKPSDASAASVARLNSSCRGSNGFSSFLSVGDAQSWVPGGHGTLRLQGFSTGAAALMFGTAVDARFPINLNGFGMPGGVLWTLPDIVMPVPLNRFVRTFTNLAVLSLPNKPVLSGARFRVQALELDASANTRGLTISSGLDVKIGKAGSRKFVARSMHWLSPKHPFLIHSSEGAPILRLRY